MEARAAAASAVNAVNATLTLLYSQVGQRIRKEVLGSKRATYGDEIVATLARQLTVEHGQGFSAENLRHMLRFAEAFPDESIVSALRRQLTWTHFRALIYFEEPQNQAWAGNATTLFWYAVAGQRQGGHGLCGQCLQRDPSGALQP